MMWSRKLQILFSKLHVWAIQGGHTHTYIYIHLHVIDLWLRLILVPEHMRGKASGRPPMDRWADSLILLVCIWYVFRRLYHDMFQPQPQTIQPCPSHHPTERRNPPPPLAMESNHLALLSSYSFTEHETTNFTRVISAHMWQSCSDRLWLRRQVVNLPRSRSIDDNPRFTFSPIRKWDKPIITSTSKTEPQLSNAMIGDRVTVCLR